jgi:hypothetical protein
MFLYERQFASLAPEAKARALTVEVLPKHLDEEVARYMVEGFGGVITQLTEPQAKYINVPLSGPFKPEKLQVLSSLSGVPRGFSGPLGAPPWVLAIHPLAWPRLGARLGDCRQP